MSFWSVLCLTLCFTTVLSVAITTQSPVSTPLARREDILNIPTFTFGFRSRYLPSQTLFPALPGTIIQLYPTGIFNEFPVEGIVVAMGDGLRKKLKDTASEHCEGGPSQECQNAMSSLLSTNDISKHTKRFVEVAGVLTAETLAALIVATLGFLGFFVGSTTDAPQEIKFNQKDMKQVQAIAGTYTFAIVSDMRLPSTVTYSPSPTTKTQNYVTIETTTADGAGHSRGDVVYHLPEDVAHSLDEYLKMAGIEETRKICKDQKVVGKRADNVQECVQRIQRHGMDLADISPLNFLQLAPQHIPVRPGPGQNIAFPVQNIAMEGILVPVFVYRRVVGHARLRTPVDGWDPVIFAKAAMSVTVAMHAAMFVGSSLLDIRIRKEELVELNEESLECPKDLICIMAECKGQEEGKSIVGFSPICKETKTYGCRCEVVTFPRVHEVGRDYVDEQYRFFEELVKESDHAMNSDAECEEFGGDNASMKIPGFASEVFTQIIGPVCEEFPTLDKSFKATRQVGNNDPSRFPLKLEFSKKDGVDKCPWTCKDVFPNLAGDEGCHTSRKDYCRGPCITRSGWHKSGKIEMACGNASYSADWIMYPPAGPGHRTYENPGGPGA